MPDHLGLTPFEEKRAKLGVPLEWQGNQVLHVRAYRGVGDELLSEWRKALIFCKRVKLMQNYFSERDVENQMLINLDEAGIPDDFPYIVMQRINEDHARRKINMIAKNIDQPVSGLGVWLTLMAPLNETGMPIRGRKLCAPNGEEPIHILSVNNKAPTLKDQLFGAIFASPTIFETFIRYGEDEKFEYFMRAAAGAKYNAAAMPAVQKRLMAVLQV